jgi:hypothetical protein
MATKPMKCAVREIPVLPGDTISSDAHQTAAELRTPPDRWRPLESAASREKGAAIGG